MINYRPSMESYRSRIHIKKPHITIKNFNQHLKSSANKANLIHCSLHLPPIYYWHAILVNAYRADTICTTNNYFQYLFDI